MNRTARGWRAVVAAAVAAMLVLTGCTPTALGDPPMTDGDVDTLARILDAAGVGIVDTPVDDPGAAVFAEHAVVVTRDQVVAMAGQVVAGSGYAGVDLDALAPVPDEVPPLSYLLAGWARDHDGPGAEAARGLLGERDWLDAPSIIWSDAVLALFVADLTADVEELGPTAIAASTGGPVAVPAGARMLPATDVGAVCRQAAGFVQNALATVYGAIEHAASSVERGVGGLFGAILGLGIRLFAELVHDVVDAVGEVTSALLAPVRTAIGIVATLQTIASAVRPWSVQMSAEPEALVLGQAPIGGGVQARVTLENGRLDFPALVTDCGGALGLEFPPPPGVGTIVSWKVDAYPVDPTSVRHDGAVRDDHIAELAYTMPAEPATAEDGLPVDDGMLRVTVTPDRDQLDKVARLVDQLIVGALSAVPGVIRDYVAAIAFRFTSEAWQRLKALVTPLGDTVLVVPVTWHFPKTEEQAAPDPRPRAPFSGPFASFCTALVHYLRDGGLPPEVAAHPADDPRYRAAAYAALSPLAPDELRDAIGILVVMPDAYAALDDPSLEFRPPAGIEEMNEVFVETEYLGPIADWFAAYGKLQRLEARSELRVHRWGAEHCEYDTEYFEGAALAFAWLAGES